ncbi:uncharacterized protein LOC135312009 isoform X1 [Phalacrocorax carbo]|uniref:uncharacterized protein LOC135312009 isoform X1 n=1 Tax=Phalacrocorax carbo TaxID=9209 RepID=UPI0031194F94
MGCLGRTAHNKLHTASALQALCAVLSTWTTSVMECEANSVPLCPGNCGSASLDYFAPGNSAVAPSCEVMNADLYFTQVLPQAPFQSCPCSNGVRLRISEQPAGATRELGRHSTEAKLAVSGMLRPTEVKMHSVTLGTREGRHGTAVVTAETGDKAAFQVQQLKKQRKRRLRGRKLGAGSGCTLMAVISPTRDSCLLPAAFLQTHRLAFDTTGPVADSELVNFLWLSARLCCSSQTLRHKAAPFGRSEIVFPYCYDAAPLSTQPAFPPIYLGGCCCCFCCCWGCCSLAACVSPWLS